MPYVNVKLQYNNQMGYNTTGGAKYTTGGNNYGLRGDRVIIMRFTHVPIPKGSTINSATLYTVMSGLNQTGTAYSFGQNVFVDTLQPSKWLDTTRDEWSGAGARSWWAPDSNSSTFNWNQLGDSRQIHKHNVKPQMDALIADPSWSAAGGSVGMLLSIFSISHSDNIFIHTPLDGWGPMLVIDYTPPASDGKATVTNIQENCNLVRSRNSDNTFSMEPFGFNPYFGTFVQPPTYTIATSDDNIPSPPFGGNMLKVVSGSGRPMVHSGLPMLEDGKWYNFSAYVFIPTSAPAQFKLSVAALGDEGGEETTTKGQWVRLNVSFISQGGEMNWLTIQGSDSPTWDATSTFYVANVQITEGRALRPYIDGNRTMTGATYGWGGSNTLGFVRATLPSVMILPFGDVGRRKSFGVNWVYSHPDGHTIHSSEIRIMRSR